jgi:hypothetical protein
MRKQTSRALLTVIAATALMVGGPASEAHAKVYESFSKTLTFNYGDLFRLENVNGEVFIESWNGNEVIIEAEKSAESEEFLRTIEIEVRETGRGVEVITHLPRLRDRYRNSGGNRAVSYTIRLPMEADLDVETVNGQVEIYAIRGAIEASTVNGNVEAEDIAGEVRISTTNGSIRADYSDLSDGNHSFSTTNGSVKLSLPPGAGGEIDARTVNGSITTDFPATVQKLSRRHLRGTFGVGGGLNLEIETVNGSVTIQER